MDDSSPNSFSWKTSLDSIVPVRDQKLSPCSWAFAAATLVSYELRISSSKVWDFEASVQHLIDKCQMESSKMLNKTRRETLEVLGYIKEDGVSFHSRYPYIAEKNLRQEIPEGPKIRIHDIVHLSKSTPLADIKNILLRHPIIASIDVYRGLLLDEFPHEEEDVYFENTGIQVSGSHYLLIIGYGIKDGKDFYQVHNSWGLAWGNYGYGRIACKLVRPFGYVTEAYSDGEFILERREHDTELDSKKPKTNQKPELMMSDNIVVGVEYSEDASDISPKVIYSRNSPDDVPPQFLTDMAALSIDAFNKRNPACLKCNFVELVRATSQACNGLLLDLEVAARHSSRAGDADAHIFKSEVWYKPGLIANTDDVLLVSASGSFMR